MGINTRRAKVSSWPAVLVLVSALAAAAVYAGSPPPAGGAAPPQELIRLETRLSQLEQRFYVLDTNVRAIEQQMRLSAAAAGRGSGDPEATLLRAEAEALRRRLADVECGLARLDERTLSEASRAARRRAGGGAADPCRLDASEPLGPRARP